MLDMVEPVRILLLGSPVITYADAPLKLSRRVHRAILYYLAFQRQSVPRSILVNWFWPDASSESVGRSRLRETLTRMRNELPSPDLLVADRESVTLLDAGFQIDTRQFHALTEESERLLAQLPPSAPLPENLRKRMTAAVELWRSPHFMEGADLAQSEELEVWLRATRHQMEGQYMRLLERLAEHDSVLGNLSAAAGWLQKALDCYPYNDPIHIRLIELFERQKRWSEALSHIQHIEHLYDLEGFEMTPALASLSQHVRERAALTSDDPAARWPGRPSVRVPMTGRTKELQLAQSAWQRGAQVLILGEAGSGKTRLIQELITKLDPAPRLLAASARPLEGQLPFQPLLDMLRLDVKPAEWRKLSLSHQSTLSLLLPELAHALGVQPPTSPAAMSRSLLFDALHQLLLLLRSQQRLLLVLDDAQWCDKTSLDALAYLMERRFFGPQATLILAARIEESNPDLNHFFNYLPESPASVRIQLERLDPEAVHEIVRFVLGFHPSANLTQRLLLETGGNTFFLLETLRTLLDFNIRPEQIEAAERLPVAGSIQTLVRERIPLLSPHAHQILHLAAILGSQAPMALLKRTANGQPDQLADALEELERVHLLQADNQIQPGGGYSFIHEKIRELVLLELGLARRQLTHLRVAQVLESMPNVPAAVLAGHFEQAGEARKAFNYWFQAATHARRLYSNSEAGEAFQRAKTILTQYASAIPDDDVYPMHIAWGNLAFDIADPVLAQQIFNGLLDIGTARSSKLLIAAGHLGLATAFDLLDQAEEGMRHLDEAAVFLNDLNRPELDALWSYRQGGFLIIANRYTEAVEKMQHAREIMISQSFPNSDHLVSSLDYRLGAALIFVGRPSEAATLVEALFNRSRSLLDQPNMARALVVLSYANHLLGADQAALVQSTDGLKIAEPLRNARLTSTFLVNQAQVEHSMGLMDDALAHAQQALELAQKANLARIVCQAFRILGDLQFTLENPKEALHYYQTGLDIAQPGYHTAEIAPRVAGILALQGRQQEAEALLQELTAFLERSGMRLFRPAALVSKVHLCYANGDDEGAIRLAGENALQASGVGLTPVRAVSYWQIARSVLRAGREDEARQKALAAVQIFRELQHPWMELRAWKIVVEAEKKTGRAAETALARIDELFDQIASHTLSPLLRPLFEQVRKNFRNFSQLG